MNLFGVIESIILEKNLPIDFHSGKLLSGEKLINNKEVSAELFAKYPDAIGGEMEGAGVASASHRHSKEWILLKGICDFADGEKDTNKDANQIIAIDNVCQFLNIFFSKIKLLANVGCSQSTCHLLKPKKERTEIALFEVYNPKFETGFQERDIDKELNKKLADLSLWIFGASGTGKTTSLRRLLNANSKNHAYISLAGSIGSSGFETLNHLIIDIESRLGVRTEHELKDLPQVVKLLGERLCELKDHKKFDSIHIDEIPFNSPSEWDIFFNGICGAIHYLAVHGRRDIKVVLSSIQGRSPGQLAPDQKRFLEFCSLNEFKDWDRNDIFKLLTKINDLLGIGLKIHELNQIVDSSLGSPRFIKRFIKNKLNSPNLPLDRLITETKHELGL